jgi:hypothetical protein
MLRKGKRRESRSFGRKQRSLRTNSYSLEYYLIPFNTVEKYLLFTRESFVFLVWGDFWK